MTENFFGCVRVKTLDSNVLKSDTFIPDERSSYLTNILVYLYMLLMLLSGGLYKGTQAPQGAAGSAYDAMSGAKVKILADGE